MTVGDMKRKVVHYLHHSPSLSAAGRRDVSGVNRGVVDVPAQPGGGGRQGGNTLSLDLIADRISADQDLNHCKVISRYRYGNAMTCAWRQPPGYLVQIWVDLK